MADVDLALVQDFALALFIGILVGIEREKDQKDAREHGTSGIRTFTLVALVGAASARLSQSAGSPWIFVAALVLVGGSVLAGYLSQIRREPTAIGLTTEISALAVCVLSGMVMYGEREVALALGIATTAVLAFKRPLHAMVGRLESQDIYAGLKLLIATFIVLPLLPDRAVDPWGALNPRSLWLLAILIAGLSLAGYVAVRWLGPARGLLLTGLFGGLASSTAVTLGFARKSREQGADATLDGALAAAILLAWVVMFARVLIEVAVVHSPLLVHLLIPLACMGVAAGIAMLIVMRRRLSPAKETPALAAGGDDSSEPTKPGLALHNPFSLTAAGKFAVLFALVELAVAGAQRYLPDSGLHALAVVAGLTDVDAITLSLAELARNGGDAVTSATGIVLAVLSNTVVKTGFVLALAARPLKLRIGFACLALLAAGAAGLLLA